MTTPLTLHGPGITPKVGDDFDVLVACDNPGIVTMTYPPGITGPATVEVGPGVVRTWRNGLLNGQYLARPGGAQLRDVASFCLEIRTADIMPALHGGGTGFQNVLPMIGSVRTDAISRFNWWFNWFPNRGHATWVGYQHCLISSPSSTSNGVLHASTAQYWDPTTPAVIRVIVIMDGTSVHFYVTGGVTPTNTATRTDPGTTTMGGTEVLIALATLKWSKCLRALSQADRVAFWDNGIFPPTPEVEFLGGHEIDPAVPKFWDTSVNALDLYNNTMVYNGVSGEAGSSGDFTDSAAFSPYAVAACTATAAGTGNITATRARKNVPSRATPLDVETATPLSVTVAAAATPLRIGPDITGSASRFPVMRTLTLVSETDGPVTLASDSAKVTVPPSVIVVDGFALVPISISGEVAGVTITATQGANVATASVALSQAVPVVPTMAPTDTLNLFPEWCWSEPHAQAISAVMDAQRAAILTGFNAIKIFDFDNQESWVLDLVAEMFGVFGWQKAAGAPEKIAFLRNSLKILRKSGTRYAVKEAIRLVCNNAVIVDILIHEGTGGHYYDGSWVYDGSVLYDSHYHWARFDVEIKTTNAAYFTDTIKATITGMINHYKPASRWLESIMITEV